MTIPFLNRVSLAEKAFLARQLATMLNSGLPLDRAIAILAGQSKNRALRTVLEAVLTDIEAGLSFSAAIARHPSVFNRVFVNVTLSGEAVGKLAEVLTQLASRLQDENEFSSKIKGALAYPIFISLTMVAVAILMTVKVVPQLKDIFTESGAQLPLATRALVAASDFLIHRWYVLIAIVAAIIFLVRFYLATSGGQLLLNRTEIWIPGIGKNLYMARFARTLHLLVQSGTPIIEAISITGEVMNNRLYQEALSDVRGEVERGIPMSVPLERSPYFPAIVSQMILVGEQTGKLDQILDNLASYYEEETAEKIKGLSSLFEPILLVVIGVAVAFLVFSILMPIYNIAQLQ